MGLSKPVAVRIAAGALLLLLIIHVPPASAQLPAPVGAAALDIHVFCPDTLIEPNYAGADEAECTLRDISRDAAYAPDVADGPGLSHTVFLSTVATNESATAEGWQTELTMNAYSPSGGEEVPFRVRAKATPSITTQDFHFDLVVTYLGPGGYNKTIIVPFTAEVGRYDFALPSWIGSQSRKAGQDEVVTYTLAMQNVGVYPDSYRFVITSPPDVSVSTPPNLYVPPGETRMTNISVLTPHGKVFEFGRNALIAIKIQSVTGSGVYGSTATLNVRGAYIPTYWIPLLLVGLASASVLARGSREKLEMRRLERGRPRRVDVTPRQAALLAELARTDPETHKEKTRALDVVYKERRADYRAHRKERDAADRAEAKQARAEFKAAKKARREQRKAEKRAAALARKEQARAAKEQRKADKVEAKLVKRKEKVLKKTRAKLEKERAKAEKREAKLAAKQAKADAAAARKAAKDAKKQNR